MSYKYRMSGESLAKFFLLGTLDRVRDRALGMLGSGSPRSLVHHALAWSHHAGETGRQVYGCVLVYTGLQWVRCRRTSQKLNAGTQVTGYFGYFPDFPPRFLSHYNRCLEAVGMPTLDVCDKPTSEAGGARTPPTYGAAFVLNSHPGQNLPRMWAAF